MSFGIPVRNGLSVSLVSSTFLSSGRRLNPALNLDFLTGGPLDPRITFSRTSQATLVDSTGKLTYAPNNVALSSQDFESTNWTKFQASITSNAAVAPDGTTTADKVIANTTTAGHSAYTNVASAASNYIFSCYAKASEYTLFRISDGVSGRIYASYDLSNGTVVSGSTGGTQFISASVTPAGNGWYRCWIVFAGNAFNYALSIVGYPNTGATLNPYGVNYTGDNVSGVLVWGAQLEQVTYQTTPGTYNSTSPKNLLGYTQEFDNAAWTKSNAFVQTNLFTYSNTFSDVSWTKSNLSVSASDVVSPAGTTDASTFTGTSTITSTYILKSASSANTYTMSFYVRARSLSTFRMQVSSSGNGIFCLYDLSTGTPGTPTVLGTGGTVSSASATMTAVGNGWYRCTLTFVQSGTNFVFLLMDTGTLDVYGAQLVQGSTAGDYQRTDAAAAAVQYVAPDGSRTADKVVPASSGAARGVYTTFLATGAPNTASVYLKAGEKSIAGFADYPGAVGAAWFNLATGEVSNVIAGYTASITSVGGGWYRCSITASPASGTRYVQIFVSDTVNSLNVTANGTDGIYIWGAQLSNSASLDPYVYNPVAAPTSAAYYGPRFDYDPVALANKGLLIEEQRTNLLTYSDQFDNAAWVKQTVPPVSVVANVTQAPDGTTSADILRPATSASTFHFVSRQTLTLTNAAHTATVYLKAGGYDYAELIIGSDGSYTKFATAYFNLATGAYVSSRNTTYTVTAYSITPVGNGWYRCSLTTTTDANSTGVFTITCGSTSNPTASFTGNGTSGIYLWGAQLEAGSFATSYIPTVASQVTRTADVALMQGANFSNWYNQNEGTFTADFDALVVANTTNANVLAAYGSATNVMRIWLWSGTAGVVRNTVLTNGTGVAELTGVTLTANTPVKAASTYRTNDFAFATNGGTAATDTSGGLPVGVSILGIGQLGASTEYLNGHIRRIGYYPTRLANAQLQSLTAQSTIPSLSLDFTTQVFNVG